MARPLHRPGNLPAETTSFIGRRSELAELRLKLATSRLVTLTGPGGVGKTRLAVRAATDLARAFPGGTWLVELADVRDPGLLWNVALAALDLRDQAVTGPRGIVLAHLDGRQALLVVDNCEHVLGAASELVLEILQAAPDVRVLATSREPLSVPGEAVLPVPTLVLPPASGAESLAQLRLNESVALFLERTAAASGRAELTDENRDAIVGVCRQLDGLPLALELAAVRTRVLSVGQIRDRLTDRFGLLSVGSTVVEPRHQALRATIEWSHDLLGADERSLFRRLAVLGGRFTLEDAESVRAGGAPAADVLDVLASLVDKSLVTREPAAGPATYHLHETMREFAALKLREAGEDRTAAAQFAAAFAARCRGSSSGSRFDLVAWLGWADLEMDNVRSVLRYCIDLPDADRGMEVAVNLRWLWATRATTEGVRWLDQLLPIAVSGSEAHAAAVYLRGFLAVLLVDPATALPALELAARLEREAGRAGPLVKALAMASVAANMGANREHARSLLAEAELVAPGTDDVEATLGLLQARSLDGLFAGDVGAAAAASSEGLRFSRGIDDLYTLKVWLLNLGTIALLSGDHAAARPLLAEALRIASDVDDRVQLAYLVGAFGCLAAASGHAQRAAQLLGAGDAARIEAGAHEMPFFAPLASSARAAAASALGPARFEAAVEVGRGLGREAAVRLALGEPDASPAVIPGPAAAGPLSQREMEVAMLVADGLTNKEIGGRLLISEHTVDSHIRGILNKLGADSRARIAAWVVSTRR